MNEFDVENEKYRNIARTLRNLSEEMRTTRDDLFTVLGHVGDAWQGPASDAFLETNEWTAKDLDKLRFEMEDLASDIEAAIARLGDA